MHFRTTLILILSTAFFAPAHAGELEGDQLYRVSTVQAVAGSLPDLLDSIASRRTGERPPLVMRHSQGDHWDLMIITAIDPDSAMDPGFLAPSSNLIAFEEDHYAYGPSWADVSSAYEDNSFYHIEMFEAVAGKAQELLEQRRMENAYLGATGLTQNMIFLRVAGSDVDAFTIGFHKDMEAFATPSDLSDEDKEAAAIEAGFKARSDISFYLRTLISGHHDTLAVKVK
jgi:hypothetical protein